MPAPILVRTRSSDDVLDALHGVAIPSDVVEDTTFVIESTLGKGALSVAFFAQRRSPSGVVPVVLKVLRPSSTQKLGPDARLLVRKEAVALGRLNECVPPNPFVVRLIDTGVLGAEIEGVPFELPWIAVEHVPGGALGPTLTHRIRHSLASTGHAFDERRAANAIACIGSGLKAVHDVGVIHRNLTAGNILSSGTATDEVFKLADFGVARPLGLLAGTLAGKLVGTPGFAAPELSARDTSGVGTWTDVFSFGAIIFYILTGERLFDKQADLIEIVRTLRRRSILDAPGLCPSLRAREPASRSIDLVIAWSTAGEPRDRLADAGAVADMVTPHLATQPARRSFSEFPPAAADLTSPFSLWSWTTLSHGQAWLAVRSVAWDGYGRAMLVSEGRLVFWNGTAFLEAVRPSGSMEASEPTFVTRIGRGEWLLGGNARALSRYSTGGVTEEFAVPREAAAAIAFSGDLDDIAVLASVYSDGSPMLHTYATRRWLRPLPLQGVAAISTLCRFDDARWLVAGQRRDGVGFAALYSALDWHLEVLPGAETCEAFYASAASTKRSFGVAGGAAGTVLQRDSATTRVERIEGASAITAVELDPFGRLWAAGTGEIHCFDEGRWIRVFHEPTWTAPFVSLYVDAGLVTAMASDGHVVEGRARAPDEMAPSS